MRTLCRQFGSHGLRAAGALFAFLALGCSGDGGTNPGDGTAGGAVSTVRLEPASSELGLGGTLQLRLTARDDADNDVTPRSTVWSSQDTLVASVSQEGVVTARRVGVVQLQAAVEGKSAFAVINVVAARVAQVAVTPATPSIAAGGATQLSARLTDAGGAVLNDRLVFWQSSNNAVAMVTSTGLVTGAGPGTATITATSEGRTGSAQVTVTGTVTPPPTGGGANNPPPADSVRIEPRDTSMVRGTTARFRARVYAGGQLVTGRTITWSSNEAALSATTGAAIDVTAPNNPNSQALVNAVVEGKAASALVRVTNRAVTTVRVTPARTSLQVGESVTVDAALLDSDNQAVNTSPAVWTTSAPAVLSVTSTGPTTARITALAAGTATVAAAADGVRGEAPITVTAPPAPTPTTTRVDVTPGSPSILVGATQQLTATAFDAQGAVRQGRTFTWQSSAPGVATVDGSGLVRAVGAGTATITATADGVNGSTVVTVTAPVVTARVDVSPGTASLTPGRTQQLTATAFDAQGGPRTGRTFAWQSSAPGVATVNAEGLVTAVAPGSATITATADGVSGTATVTVGLVPVARVDVTPATGSIDVGRTLELTATARDAGGAPLAGRPTSWTSSNPAVATVSNTGVVTGVGGGTATITATVEGASGTAAVTVTVPTVTASVAVTPGTASVAVGATTQLTATARDQSGAVRTGRTFTWTSSDPAIATVSNTGVVTGVAGGTATITATADGVSGTATVTVTVPPRTAAVEVTPSTATLVTGGTQQLTATVRDQFGAVRTGRTVTWQSSAPAVATVDANGRVTAVGPGSATITATADGVSGTATITVAAAVSRVVVEPSTASMRVNTTRQFTAVTYDAADTVLSGRSCTWVYNKESGPPIIDINSATGLVQARNRGTASITATCEGRLGNATVSVTN